MYRCAANFNAVRFRSFSCLSFDLVPVTTAAAEREKAKKKAAQQSAQSSRVGTPPSTPKRKKTSTTGSGVIGSPLTSGASTPIRRPLVIEKPDQQLMDLAGLNLQVEELHVLGEETPRISLAREKLLEEVAKVLQTGMEGGKRGLNLVVIGNLSTLVSVSSVWIYGMF
jgi:hypothetical protein